MAKPDPQLLEPSCYPVRLDVATRFQDLDPNNHVNNVAFAVMFEDVRVRFDWGMGLREAMHRHRTRTMIASLGIEYLGEMFYPEQVEGCVGILSIGRTSWTVAGILAQGGRVAGFMRATMVCIADGAPTPVPAEFREALERHRVRLDEVVS